MADRYLVLKGINYGPTGKRAEPGKVIADLPDSAIGPLTEKGAIKPVPDEQPAKPGKEKQTDA